MKWCSNKEEALTATSKNCCGYFDNKSMIKLKTNSSVTQLSPMRTRKRVSASTSYLSKLLRKLNVMKRECHLSRCNRGV